MTKVLLGKFASLEVDESKFNDQVKAYIFAYGLKQVLNDAHASVTEKTEADAVKRNESKVAMAEKKLASLYAGNVAQARGSRGVDAVERMMFSLAETAILAKLPKIGKKRADFKTAVWNELVNKQVAAKSAEYRERAIAALGEDDDSDDDILALMADESEAAEGESGDETESE